VNAGVSKEDAAAIAGEAAGAASEAAKAQVRMRTLGMKLGSLLEQRWWLQVDRMRMLQRQLPMQHGKPEPVFVRKQQVKQVKRLGQL
jgi:hypothetical protein